jgi:ABC-type dipeptide/oligopeptide/nickel transport system ATPase component
MPKKKKEEAAEVAEIVNWYEKIPKEMLDKAENPNFNVHKLKVPFRMCVVAPSGSGKSNFLVNLIHLFSQGKGTFADITIITRNKDEPLYNFLTSKCDQIQVKEGLTNLPQLDKMDKRTNHLVCFDDLVLAKDQSAIENYYIRARKLNCSVIYLSQSYFRIPKMIRNNCSYMVILKLSGNREVNLILSEFGLGVSREQLLSMYEYATKEKFSPLLIDLEEDPSNRFRKGFKEILDPAQYVPIPKTL